MPSPPPRPADGELLTVWALTRGAGQTVAVIDTGVARHRRLPHLVPGGDFVSTGDGAADCDGHGTIVAGIIAAAPDADDPGAFSGIAPDVTLSRFGSPATSSGTVEDPAGSGFGDVETLAAAVRIAADLGATVINISSVACLPADGDLDDRALGAALAYAVDVANAVVVTAAGNVGGPGQCPAPQPRRRRGGQRRHRDRQPRLVRRLRADGRFGRGRRRRLHIQPDRPVGRCRSPRRECRLTRRGRRRAGDHDVRGCSPVGHELRRTRWSPGWPRWSAPGSRN